MIGFLIKKAFFDFWDNMIRVVLINLGFIAVIGVGVYLPYLLRFNTVLAILSLIAVLIVFNVYAGAASFMAWDMVNYRASGFTEFKEHIKTVWKSSLILSLITGLQVIVLFVAYPFYTSIGGVLGLGALSLIFWISIVWWLAAQYFFPIRSQLDDNPKKILKKCFLLLFDNTGFTIFLGIGTVATLVLTSFTAFLLPGFTGIMIWHQAALKLRLRKYDYIEENPGVNRKRIPWDALLIDERDKVGPRTFKGMIFPWKD